MNKINVYLLMGLIVLFLTMLGMIMQSNALEVNTQNTQPSELKVVRSSSEIINGKVVLQPTFNPQQQ